MTQDTPTRVTTRQNDYLLFLEYGPKTTRDFVLEFMVTTASITKLLGKLRDAGLVKSERAIGTRGNVHNHDLTAPYPELNIIIRNNATGATITDDEIIYAAKLRNAGLLGQRLTEAHHRKYPNRTSKAISNIVMTARKRRLCL
jgi:hypothetical protein